MAAVIRIQVTTEGGIDQVKRDVADLGDAAKKSGGGFNALQEVATGALRAIGGAAVELAGKGLAAIGDFVTGSISAAGDFEAGMNLFGAAAGEGFEQGSAALGEFQDLFLDLGKKLPVSTQEVQDAATALVKGGLDPAVIKAGALESALNFAAAAGMGLADAAELTTKMLGTFVPIGASVEEQTRFMADAQNLLVKAAGASTLDVDKLGDAMLAAGGQARAAGLEYDDFVTTMGLISPSFGSAAESGTSFKNFLVRLQPTADKATQMMEALGLITEDGSNKFYDAQGQFLGMQNAAELLQGALSGLSDAERINALQTIFGNDAMGAATALAGAGAEGYDLFAQKMNAANGVQAQSAATQQGYNFAMENLKGSLEALQITLGTALLPVLATVLGMLNTGVGVVMGFAETFLKLAPSILTSNDPINTFFNILRIAAPQAVDFIGQVQGIVDTFLGFAGPVMSGGQALIGVVQSIFPTVVSIVQTAFSTIWGIVQSVVPPIWSTVQTVFGTIQTYIPAVLSAVASFIQAVLAQIMTFWNAHGAEVMAFIQTSWTTISTIINTAVQLILEIVIGTFSAVAAFINDHGAEIQAILTNVWNIIYSVITAALALIQGIIKTALQIMHGDWEGAWTTIQQMSARIVMEIYNAIVNALDLIARFLGSSLEEYGQLWDRKWGELVRGAQALPGLLGNVGSSIVNAIKDGFMRQWNDFISAVERKLQQLQDMLPFSEPKDTSSPLYGLSKSGEAIVANMQAGIDAAGTLKPPNLGSVLTAPVNTGPIASQSAGMDFFSTILRHMERQGQSLSSFNYAPTINTSASVNQGLDYAQARALAGV